MAFFATPALPTRFCTFTPPRSFHTQRARKYYPRDNRYVLKNNFRGITMGKGPIWGINSLSFILLRRLLIQNTKNFPSKSFKLDSFVSDCNHFLKLTFLSGCYLIQCSYLCIPCMLYVTQNMRRPFLKKTWIYIYCDLKLHAINSVKKN